MISKQALDQRFNQPAKVFFKKVLEVVLNNIFTGHTSLLSSKAFQAMKIKDSTCFQLPESYKTIYPGSGGEGSEAGMRIQFEYDLFSGSITDLSLHAFNRQDVVNARETIDQVNEGELIVRDLAYFSQMDIIGEITARHGYFIAKLSPSIKKILISNDQQDYSRIDFEQLLERMNKKGLQRTEYQALIGENKHQVRLLIEVVPDQVYEQRLRKATKKSRSLKKEYKARMRLNIYITNVNNEQLSHQAIQEIYRLRWQIELMFKTWKSYAKMAETKPMKCRRFECLLLGKLIWFALQCRLVHIISYTYLKEGLTRISMMKLCNMLTKRVKTLWQSAGKGYVSITKNLKRWIDMAGRYCVFERKKKHPNSYQIIEEFLIYSCQSVDNK